MAEQLANLSISNGVKFDTYDLLYTSPNLTGNGSQDDYTLDIDATEYKLFLEVLMVGTSEYASVFCPNMGVDHYMCYVINSSWGYSINFRTTNKRITGYYLSAYGAPNNWTCGIRVYGIK